jgi:NADPH:quinone reductase-like Zn-dependent oxidoreductase
VPATFPFILGADLAGVVEASGIGATRFSAGDDVFGQLLLPPLVAADADPSPAEVVDVSSAPPAGRRKLGGDA